MAGGKVLVFGSGSGIGAPLMRALEQRGVGAVGITRSGRDGSMAADVTDAAAVQRVFAAHPDATAVVSIVGGRPFRKDATPPDLVGNRHLIDTAKARGLQRFVLVSTIGAGDSRAAAPLIARLILGRFMKLKTEAEALLRESGLDWTVVRPGHLQDAAPTGRAVLREDPGLSGAVTRADVGVLIAALLDDRATVGRTYACVEPRAG